ncbi:Apulose-4-phosphate transketolase subunit B [subsurface metagenome]
MATGTMLHKAKITAELLLKKRFGVTLISLHTIKPLDKMIIKNCSRKYKSIFTIEEHSIIGGLGSAVVEELSEVHYDGLFKRIGLPDKFNHYIGKTEYLHRKYGLTPEDMANNITELIKEA